MTTSRLSRTALLAISSISDCVSRRERLIPGEVESHVPGLVVRPGLVGVRAERLAQRRVDEVGAPSAPARAAAVLRVDDARRRRTDADLAAAHLHGVADQALDRLLHVEHLELVAGADDHARVGVLAAGLRIQRGLGEDHLGDLAAVAESHRLAVDDQAEHARLGLEVGVAGEHRLAGRPERRCTPRGRPARSSSPSHPPSRARAALPSGSRRRRGRRSARPLPRSRASGRSGSRRCRAAGMPCHRRVGLAGPLRVRNSDIEDARAAGERAQEGLLFGIRQP